jgi:hypothetical protein
MENDRWNIMTKWQNIKSRYRNIGADAGDI